MVRTEVHPFCPPVVEIRSVSTNVHTILADLARALSFSDCTCHAVSTVGAMDIALVRCEEPCYSYDWNRMIPLGHKGQRDPDHFAVV